VAGRGKPLILRAYAFGDPLISGQWGIREPAADAPEAIPDVMLVPLAAFDRTGHRIGYGAGYYDMTIAKARALKPVTAIGIAFGTIGSFIVARWLTTLLFGVRPGDPTVFLSTAALLLLVATAACLIPARRATRVDPMIALRTE